ncbi:MAG: hypothetical protein LBL84_02695 [Candidatus Nomurabacteria bacterium]|jgi:hypothetical protein|nr:hypothetical protein [Candidatus Nomurabacteria bacterium]
MAKNTTKTPYDKLTEKEQAIVDGLADCLSLIDARKEQIRRVRVAELSREGVVYAPGCTDTKDHAHWEVFVLKYADQYGAIQYLVGDGREVNGTSIEEMLWEADVLRSGYGHLDDDDIDDNVVECLIVVGLHAHKIHGLLEESVAEIIKYDYEDTLRHLRKLRDKGYYGKENMTTAKLFDRYGK